MNFQISNFKFQIQQGYTLVELMVVLTVMGIIFAMSIYGLKSSNASQAVDNAQKEFASNLRAVQNRVDNGEVVGGKVVQEIGIPASGTTYSINTTKIITLPSGVTMTNKVDAVAKATTLCMADRNLDKYAGTNICANCTSGGVGFVCNLGATTATSPGLDVVTFTSGTVSKKVTIKGSGMRITEINTK